ncbi:hypothetical protein GKODMF_08640 [Candidatus Electrothrix gigas]
MLPLSQEDKELINQLNRHPDIKDRMKSIVSGAFPKSRSNNTCCLE